ncbi:hypothetical protein PHYSODRAFT_263235, partial [Phytophthora sojae]
ELAEYEPSYYTDYVKEEPEEVQQQRTPSGFIPMYTGTEKRLPGGPVFGWSVGAQQGGYGGWGTVPKPTVKMGRKVKVEPTAKSQPTRPVKTHSTGPVKTVVHYKAPVRTAVRFHNLFLSRTADQLWERLQSAHRERGESVEEWGDRVTDLCDSLDYPNRKMRYQLSRRGLRNKRILACLDSGPARDIPEACEWLLAKEMSRPIEEDDELSDETKKSSGSDASPANDPMAAVGVLAEKMTTFMTQQQQWQQQMMQNRWQPPRSPRNRMPNVSATTSNPGVGMNGQGPRGNGRPVRGIRMGADSRTQEGAPVCGRCGYVGHSRETRRHQSMTCHNCGVHGHIAVECEAGPNNYQRGPGTVGRNGGRGVTKCAFCEEEGHLIVNGSSGGDRDREAEGGTVTTVDVCVNASRKQTEPVSTLRGASCAEKKNKKKKVGFKIVGTDEEGEGLVADVEAKEVEVVYEDLVAASPERCDEVGNGGETTVTGLSEDCTVSEPPTVTREERNAVVEVTPPEEVVAWKDEEYDVSDCLFAAWTDEETVLAESKGVNGTVEARTVETKTVEAKESSKYDRWFTDEELDPMDDCEPGLETSVLAGTDVAAEPEEYDKELEDRLYPLDEVELLKRVEQNAKAQTEPSAEELARFLGISLEALERTRQAASDYIGTPEYWQDWYGDMLEKSEEAKRANRDFRTPVANVVYGEQAAPSGTVRKALERSGVGNDTRSSDVSSERSDSENETVTSVVNTVVESFVCENGLRPADDPG